MILLSHSPEMWLCLSNVCGGVCFQEVNMWQDALRVCKEYLPNKLPQLQDEYDREMTDKTTR